MARRPHLAPLVRAALAIALALTAIAGLAGPRGAEAAALPRWTGGIDLYRAGTFTTQQTWLWCTAADAQIMRNIVHHRRDHSRASQQRYFDDMRRHNRYDIPVSDGVDPAGWAAGLQRFVDSRYRLVVSDSFNAALRSAVRNLRRTNLPVGITVSHGNHAWVLTGFTATADPAVTNRFTVTSVRVTGPLWGLQSRSYGYDMRPDTRLTPGQLRGFFTRWHYAGIRMAWEGSWVSIQPVAPRRAPPAATPRPTPAAPGSTASPAPASPTAVATDPATEAASDATPPAPPSVPGEIALAAPATAVPTAAPTPPAASGVVVRDPPGLDFDAGLAVLVGVAVVAAVIALQAGRVARRRR